MKTRSPAAASASPTCSTRRVFRAHVRFADRRRRHAIARAFGIDEEIDSHAIRDRVRGAWPSASAPWCATRPRCSTAPSPTASAFCSKARRAPCWTSIMAPIRSSPPPAPRPAAPAPAPAFLPRASAASSAFPRPTSPASAAARSPPKRAIGRAKQICAPRQRIRRRHRTPAALRLVRRAAAALHRHHQRLRQPGGHQARRARRVRRDSRLRRLPRPAARELRRCRRTAGRHGRRSSRSTRCCPAGSTSTAGISSYDELPRPRQGLPGVPRAQTGVEIGCISTGPGTAADDHRPGVEDGEADLTAGLGIRG